MTGDNQHLYKVIKDIAMTEEIKEDDTMSEKLGFSSIDYVELAAWIGHNYQINIAVDELSSQKTVSDIEALIVKKHQQIAQTAS